MEEGWTLDVWKVVQALGKKNFALSDVLKHSDELSRLHPENQHIEEKIRQQLQVLRDMGKLRFIDNKGNYSLL